MDIASLGIKIDSSQAKTATGSLDSMAKAGERAEDSLAAVEKAGAGAAQGIAKADKAAVDASKSIAKTGDAGKGLDAAKKSADQLAKALEDVKATASGTGSFADAYKLPTLRANISQTVTSFGTVTKSAEATASAAARIKVPTAAADGFRSLGQAAGDAERNTTSLVGASAQLSAVLGGLGIAYAVSQFVKYADAATTINSQLKLVTTSSENLIAVQNRLFDVSQNARVGFQGLVGTYSQIARATEGLGISQSRILGVTDTISKAITISGSSAASSQAALIQLSQGLASGTLRGEELNSVMEQTPRLAQALAQGLGVSIGRLREMGAAGELTADKIITALEKSAGRIDREFAGVAITVAQSFVKLENAAVRSIGQIDRASGVSTALAGAVSAISDAVTGVGDAISGSGPASDLLSGAAGAAAAAIAIGGVAGALGAVRLALLGISTAASPAVLAILGIGALGAAGAVGVGLGLASLASRLTDKGIEKTTEALDAQEKQVRKNIESGKLDADQLAANNATLEKIATKRFEINQKAIGGDKSDSAHEFQKLENAELERTQRILDNLNKKYETRADKLDDALKSAKALLGVETLPADLEANIRAKFKERTPKAKSGATVDRAQLGFDIDAIRNQLNETIRVYDNADRILEAQRAASLVNEGDYYEAKRKMIELDARARVDSLREENARFAQENADLTKAGLADPARAAAVINNRKAIADNNSKMGAIEAKALADVTIATLQQGSAVTRLAIAQREAEAAAQSYFDTQVRQQQRDLNALGQGNQARDRNAGRNQIEDRYAQQRLQLESDKRRGSFLGREDDYKAELDRINRFQTLSLESYERYYGDLIGKSTDWTVGASEATYNYLDDARNVAKQTDTLFSDAFGNIEDAVVSFVKTGKINFSSLADAFISEIVRMQVKAAATSLFGGGGGAGFLSAIGSVAGLFGGTGAQANIASSMGGDSLDNFLSLTGGFGTGARAIGGPVSPGGLYRVNERGPELLDIAGEQYLMTAKGGMVKPLKSGSESPGGQPRITINNLGTPMDYSVDSVSRDEIVLIAQDQVRSMAPGVVANDMRRSNSVTNKATQAAFKVQPKR